MVADGQVTASKDVRLLLFAQMVVVRASDPTVRGCPTQGRSAVRSLASAPPPFGFEASMVAQLDCRVAADMHGFSAEGFLEPKASPP
eukprot:9202179-Pyramimonas_sp.AAC.2